jgi:hypothetical protein
VTLVVAEIARGGIAVWADTALRKDDDRRSGFYAMGLKNIVLHSGLCVAFAGGAEEGTRAIFDLGVDRQTGFDIDEVQRSLLASPAGADGTVDFVVASVIPTPSLLRVTAGHAVEVQRTYIGLPEAYSKYHAVYDTSGTSVREVADRMNRAMEQLVEDPFVEGVGGLSVGVSTRGRGFEYDPPWATIASTGLVELPSGSPAGTYLLPMPKTAAEGGYRYIFGVPADPGIGALAMYFQPGNLGLLLYPMADLYPIPFPQVTQGEFGAGVADRYGIHLQFHGQLHPDW